MWNLSEYAKAILIFVLKLILKKRGKTPVLKDKDDRKLCQSMSTSSGDKNETTDDSFYSMTTSELSLSSGIGSSICSIDSRRTSAQEVEVFDLESPEVCSLGAEIERLRTENKALQEKLSRNMHPPEPTEPDVAERSPLYSTGKTSLCQVMSITSKVHIDDVVRENLKLKLKMELEENRRLQNYINDVVYMVLETRPNLLEN